MTRNVTILGTTQNVDRYYPVAAAFFELQLPVLQSVNVQLAGRYEKFYSDITDVDNDVFVPAGAVKWQPLDWLGLRLSAGRTFSQVNPPENDGRTTANSVANNDFGGFGGTGTAYSTFSYDNTEIESEESTYWNFGFLISQGAFSMSVDYWRNKLEKGTRTLTTDQILRALIADTPKVDALINCSSPLFNPDPVLTDQFGVTHAVIELNQNNGRCIQGQSRLNSGALPGEAPGLVGGQIHYTGDLGETNGGTIDQSGIDFNISYAFDLFGGTLRPSMDLTYYLTYDYEDFELFGVTVAQGYDAIGFTNTGPGRLLQAVPEYRGSIGINYSRGAHTVNLLARYLPAITNDDVDDFNPDRQNNANIGDANGFTTGPAGACSGATPTLSSDLGNVPAGNGTGQYGSGANVVPPGSAAAVSGGRGFCNGQNVALQSFQELKASYNLDLTYRVELPQQMQLTFSIYNLTNEEPEFSRSQLSYSAFFGSPLERNFELGFRKRF
jgi:outer membrane receptor protein involved in Fe transport